MSLTTDQPESPETVTLTSGMTDKELIGYCESHCQTDLALFSAAQVNRMLELSDCMQFNEPVWPATRWLSLHGDMARMCELARERMKAADVPVYR